MTIAQYPALAHHKSRRARRRRPSHLRRHFLPITFGFYLFILVVLSLAYSQNTNSFSFNSKALNALVRNTAANEVDDICKQEPGENNFLKSRGALGIYIPGILVLFVGLAVITDDYFVPALERICEKLDLSEDVAGATFMAAGSSAPELFTSLLATFVTKDDVGVGTIVGSAVFNVLVIIGVSAIMAGKILKLDWRPLIRDSSFYAMSIILLLVFVLGSSKGEIQWWEGLILMMGYVGYIAFMKWGNAPYMKFAKQLFKKKKDQVDLESGVEQSGTSAEEPGFTSSSMDYTTDTNSSATPSPDSSPDSSPEPGMEKPFTPAGLPEGFVGERNRDKYRGKHMRFKFKDAAHAVIIANHFARTINNNNAENAFQTRTNDRSDIIAPTDSAPDLVTPIGQGDGEIPRKFLGVEVPSSIPGKLLFPVTFIWQILFKYTVIPNCAREEYANWWPLTFILSIAWIGGLSYAMVEAARLTGCLIRVPSAVMGLTVLAAGTSIPDALASVAVAKQGQGDMAVSNALGSNVFDILLGLGLPIFLGGLINKEPLNITVSPVGTVVVPIAILFAVLVVLLLVTAAMRWKLRPALGYVLLAVYFLFLTYSFLDAYVFMIGG